MLCDLCLSLFPPVLSVLCSNTAVQAGGGGCCCGLMVKVVCLLDQLDLLKPAIYSAGSLCLAKERTTFHQLNSFSDLFCSLRQPRERHVRHGGNRAWPSKRTRKEQYCIASNDCQPCQSRNKPWKVHELHVGGVRTKILLGIKHRVFAANDQPRRNTVGCPMRHMY
ncbi:hypothetical protein GQ54DRAFT_142771 [Martensiomyces pterosporus]|nr:hypothetical protein GQ54DRAFT_142771 [Martensiomyces pterosporus]